MKVVSKSLVILGLAALLAGTTGCANIAEKAAEKAAEAAAEKATGGKVDINKGGVTVKGKDGESASFGDSVEIPEDFPKDVPVYEGKVIGAYTDGKTWTINLETKDAFAKVLKFYKTELEAKGWVMESNMNTNQGGMYAATKDTRRCAATAAPQSGDEPSTSVTISITPK